MSQNPYSYGDEVDADIFGDEEKRSSSRHPIDGSVCPTCNITHRIEGLPEGLPPRLLKKLQEIVDTMPDDVVRQIASVMTAEVPIEVSFIREFMDFLSSVDTANHHGPMLRAIVEILDEQTDGAVTKRWRVYDIERRLYASFMALKALNTNLDDAVTSDAPELVIRLFTLMVDFLVDRIAVIVTKYRQAAEEAGLEPHEQLIATGNFKDVDDVVLHTMIQAVERAMDRKRR